MCPSITTTSFTSFTSTTLPSPIHTSSNNIPPLLQIRQPYRIQSCNVSNQTSQSSTSSCSPDTSYQSSLQTLYGSTPLPTRYQMHSIQPAAFSKPCRLLRLFLTDQLRLIYLVILVSLKCLPTIVAVPVPQGQPFQPSAGSSAAQLVNDIAAVPTDSSIPTTNPPPPQSSTTTIAPSPTESLSTTINVAITSTASQITATIVPATAIQSTIATMIISSLDKTTNLHSSSSSHTQTIFPTKTPRSGTANDRNNNSIMLIVSLAVVLVVLASMGLVVFCLFRRRSVKRRLHLFGKGKSSASTSADGLNNISNNGLGALARTNSNRRTSDMNMSKALQEMTEQHQSALLSRKSSTLSLGAQAGNCVLSPTLTTSRPYPQGIGYCNHSSLGLGTDGDFVAASMVSPYSYGSSQYNGWCGTSGTPQQFPYMGTMGGSPDINNNDQLLLPHHHMYRSGFLSGNMSRRSSLSPGLYPQSETFRTSSPLFRAKTISTSSGHGYQAPGYGTPHHSYPYHYYGNHSPRHPSSDHSSPVRALHTNLNEAQSNTENFYDSGSSRTTSESQKLTAVSSYGHGMARPQSPINDSQSVPNGMPSNIIIPPSITTRRRSIMNSNGVHTTPSQDPYYHHQQQQKQSYYPNQEYNGHNQYPSDLCSDQVQPIAPELAAKDDKIASRVRSGSENADMNTTG